MAHFYLRDDLWDAQPGAIVELSGAEARHAVTVSRTRPGEAVTIGNGRGLVVRGEVTAAEPALVAVRARTVERVEPPRPVVTLVQALAKGGRDELAVQTATELGVDRVVPWESDRSIVRWSGAKRQKGRERWQAIAREAGKQSMRAWLPAVEEAADAHEVAASAGDALVLVLDPNASDPLSGVQPDGRDIVLIVGPEGGITDREFTVFAGAGGRRVRLGDAVLRTSSAGPAALAVLNVALGRW
jgi:16S rRNA (uracil1498-N3)-methyltransferase